MHLVLLLMLSLLVRPACTFRGFSLFSLSLSPCAACPLLSFRCYTSVPTATSSSVTMESRLLRDGFFSQKRTDGRSGGRGFWGLKYDNSRYKWPSSARAWASMHACMDVYALQEGGTETWPILRDSSTNDTSCETRLHYTKGKIEGGGKFDPRTAC